jgi:hypothetical protein
MELILFVGFNPEWYSDDEKAQHFPRLRRLDCWACCIEIPMFVNLNLKQFVPKMERSSHASGTMWGRYVRLLSGSRPHVALLSR